jgi:hypothetical protein
MLTIPSLNEDYCARELDAETIFLSPDGRQLFAVNELGTYILSRLDGSTSLRDVRDGICERYEVSAEQAEADLLEFIDAMVQRNLLVLAP